MERKTPDIIIKEAFVGAMAKGIFNVAKPMAKGLAKPLVTGSFGPGGLFLKGMQLKEMKNAPKVFKSLPAAVGRSSKIKRMV